MTRWLLALFIIVVAAFAILGCPAAVCEQLETRCASDVAQVCNADGQWQVVMDCGQVEPGAWSCGEDPDEGHTCNPTER